MRKEDKQTFVDWQANNEELFGQVKDSIPRVAELQNSFLECMNDALKDVDLGNEFEILEFLDKYGPRVGCVNAIVATFNNFGGNHDI